MTALEAEVAALRADVDALRAREAAREVDLAELFARNARVFAHETETLWGDHDGICCIRAELGVPAAGPTDGTLDTTTKEGSTT